MDFFKSVFSDPTPSPSLASTSTSPVDAQTTSPSELDSPSKPWAFGSTLFSTIASKSEALLDNYYKDIQEFSSGLKKETSVIRQAASRAVQNLPSRLESGAAIAQESLEAVGQAIDNVGSTVSEIIAKDLNLASQGGFFGAHFDEIGGDAGDNGNYEKDSGFSENVKPYSRIDAMVRSLQCSVKTYCEEVEDSDYIEWKMGFRLEEKGGEIERLVEENGVIGEIYDEVVPKKVDEETFWCLYFYKVQKVIEAEEARARFVKRAIEEEEELSWDVDDDDNDYNDSHEGRAGFEEDELNKDMEDNGKKVRTLQLKSGEKGVERDDEDEAGVSGSKSENSAGEESLEERFKSNDKEGSEGKIESDFSVVSSQRFDEDYVGWDEIEAAFGSGDEGKITDHGSSSTSNLADLRKRLSAAEQDEELTWDVENDDDKHIKS
ncbi:uncharacterized protein LOC142547268 [Primulina tabacum]|uniref:uncharacterized protein LOC142547268 n=1 Tax=Primulina tabacum TaxID=48773 RepID=UPI003F590C18